MPNTRSQTTTPFSRRQWMQCAGLSTAAMACGGLPQAGAAARKPNIVVILADDLGYGDLACYGSNINRTPHLDRMAAEGVRFTDFYTPMPFCAPTRASLLTGRYPFRSGMTRNPAPDGGMNEVGLPDTEVSLAQALKQQGYATTCIGKWHLGHLPQFMPRKRGFDEYYGILYSNDMRPVQLVHNEQVVQYPVIQADLTKNYTDRAIQFVERNKDNPFFLYLPHAMPHKPLAASEDFYTPETPGDLYKDVIEELDFNVGRLLARIKQLGLDENTLVMFTSDNGPWYGGSTGVFRGMKGRTWEGGVRVPMIARWPGRIPAGRVTREAAGTIDIYPTACAAAGGGLPKDRVIDGRDTLPLMTGKADKSPHEALFAMAGDRLAIVRSGKWKLHVLSPGTERMYSSDPVAWVDPRGPDGVTIVAQHEQARPTQYPGVNGGPAGKEMMLFDVQTDPAEQNDVAAQNPDVVQRLKGFHDKLNAQVTPPPPLPKRSGGAPGLKRLKGGELRYDVEPKRPQ